MTLIAGLIIKKDNGMKIGNRQASTNSRMRSPRITNTEIKRFQIAPNAPAMLYPQVARPSPEEGCEYINFQVEAISCNRRSPRQMVLTPSSPSPFGPRTLLTGQSIWLLDGGMAPGGGNHYYDQSSGDSVPTSRDTTKPLLRSRGDFVTTQG